MRKYETDERYSSQFGFQWSQKPADGRRFLWRRERWRACSSSLTPLKTEQHLIPTSLSFDTQSLFWYHRSTMAWPRSAEALRSPLTVSKHKSLTYDRANSSALQATATCGTQGQVIVNDTTDWSERLPVINDTSTMTTWVKGCQLSTIQPTWVKSCQLSMIQPT